MLWVNVVLRVFVVEEDSHSMVSCQFYKMIQVNHGGYRTLSADRRGPILKQVRSRSYWKPRGSEGWTGPDIAVFWAARPLYKMTFYINKLFISFSFRGVVCLSSKRLKSRYQQSKGDLLFYDWHNRQNYFRCMINAVRPFLLSEHVCTLFWIIYFFYTLDDEPLAILSFCRFHNSYIWKRLEETNWPSP